MLKDQKDLNRDNLRHQFILTTFEVAPEMWDELKREPLERYKRLQAQNYWRIEPTIQRILEANTANIPATIPADTPMELLELYSLIKEWGEFSSLIKKWMNKWNLKDDWCEEYILPTLHEYSRGNFEYSGPSLPGYSPKGIELPEPPKWEAPNPFNLKGSWEATKKTNQEAIDDHNKKISAILEENCIVALHRKDDRPITWLAKYQVLKQTIKEVADSEKSEFLSDSAVQKAIERFAEEIDLTLRDGKRGKRKSKN